MAQTGQRRTADQGQSPEAGQRVRLVDVGLSEKESSRFQQAASAPRERVEEVLQTARETQVPVTSASRHRHRCALCFAAFHSMLSVAGSSRSSGAAVSICLSFGWPEASARWAAACR